MQDRVHGLIERLYALRALPAKIRSIASPSSPRWTRQSRYSCISKAQAAASSSADAAAQWFGDGEVTESARSVARNIGQSAPSLRISLGFQLFTERDRGAPDPTKILSSPNASIAGSRTPKILAFNRSYAPSLRRFL